MQDVLVPQIPKVLYFVYVYVSIFQNTIFTLIINGILVYIDLSQPLRVRVLCKGKRKRKRWGRQKEEREGRKLRVERRKGGGKGKEKGKEEGRMAGQMDRRMDRQKLRKEVAYPSVLR